MTIPKERPILLSPPMVRATLEDRKTMTRRVIDQPVSVLHSNGTAHSPMVKRRGDWYKPNEWSPYGRPGELLWVREGGWIDRAEHRFFVYAATPNVAQVCDGGFVETHTKPDAAFLKRQGYLRCPSIHMPRWASRLTLRITDVRVERLQEISAEDCIAEGLWSTLREHDAVCDLRNQYRVLWNMLNAKRGHPWKSNPWVWVLSYERVIA